MMCAITGASSGLGKAIARLLVGYSPNYVWNLSKESGPYGEWVYCDLVNPDSIADAAARVNRAGGCDTLINCAGVNEINWLEDLNVEDYDRVMAVNTRAVFLLTRALLPGLKRDGVQLMGHRKGVGTILNIISNASHVPMTASLAYNASKGALHIMTLQMARELTRKYGITVFGISPNKLKGTGMSQYIESRVPEVRGWTPEQAEEYQRASLLTGEETDPEVLAEFIAFLLYKKQNHKYLSGCIIPYGA